MFLPLAPPQASLPFISPALGSHMVMQRGKPNAFWGWAAPGTAVAVEVGGQKARAVAGSDGKWIVKVQPPKVGGPYTVKIDGTQHVELTDVLVGDVWVCAGQSNMEFGLPWANDATTEVAAANDPQMRIFLAPHQTGFAPLPTNGGTWKPVTPETIAQDGWGGFSAVGYHFGKALRREVGVPIGLVQLAWGGTNAESWASREAIAPLKDFNAWFPTLDEGASGNGLLLSRQVEAWYGANDLGTKAEWQRADLDDSGWGATSVPNGFHGLGLDAFDGVAWFRRTIELTAAQATGAARLALGSIDDADTTWINGQRVGETANWMAPRGYAVPAGTLRAGRNTIAVRIMDTGTVGGFTGRAEDVVLTLSDGTKMPLAGEWRGKAGGDFKGATPYPRDLRGDANVPTSLSNGMVEPEVPLAIRGAIWYQGENNAERAEQYRRVLPAMIGDWRRRFGQGDLPFYIVSLANFTAHKDKPGEDAWAELREAQDLAARTVPNSGLAVTIDVGDAADIHPKDKKTVGERLALIALAKSYGRSVVYSGPTYKSLVLRGSEARVSFDHADGGLLTRGGPLGEFAVAGADHVWHWADARIEGSAVVVSSTAVASPVAVRYAWQSNPRATLYNGAGLPAVPFRTDDWPLSTLGKR